LSATFSYEGKKSTKLGNRPVAENTKDNYKGNYWQATMVLLCNYRKL